MRMIFSSGSPAILRHSAAASSSSANTVISRRSLSSAKSRVSNSQASRIARSLK